MNAQEAETGITALDTVADLRVPSSGAGLRHVLVLGTLVGRLLVTPAAKAAHEFTIDGMHVITQKSFQHRHFFLTLAGESVDFQRGQIRILVTMTAFDSCEQGR